VKSNSGIALCGASDEDEDEDDDEDEDEDDDEEDEPSDEAFLSSLAFFAIAAYEVLKRSITVFSSEPSSC
jgi:hypothetical protein